jgi:hypothetical protein
MKNNNCTILLGKDLNSDQLKQINYLRKKEFNSQTDINPKPDNEDWDKVFIILESPESHKLLAFCRLHKVLLSMGNDTFNVVGFATLISTQKRKGYGSKILKCSKYYSSSERKPILGFCNPDLKEFYSKNDFKILSGGVNKFIYKDEHDNEVPPKYTDSIAFMYDNSGILIKYVNENKGKINISMSHW